MGALAASLAVAGQERSGWVRGAPPDRGASEPETAPAVSSVWELDGELFCDHVPAEPALNAFTFGDDARWSSTATDGPGLVNGEPTTLTWGFAPDGTMIDGWAGEPTSPSNLIAFLDAIRGEGPGGTDLRNRPWFHLFEQIFEEWSEVSGVRYVYQATDDGAFIALLNTPPGQLGVRPDVRIGGHPIDGERGSNILAYNFFPNNGEMVLDTTNPRFFADPSNDSLPLRNALAHEHGHGLGLKHVCPVGGTKLMEPYVNLGFDGPQEDDVLAANRGYGDRLEPPNGNDTLGTAAALGALGTTGSASVGNVSVDGVSDADFYSFTAGPGALATVTLTPTGGVYSSGPQNTNGTCSAGSLFDARRQSDLTLELLDGSGTSLAFANGGGLGAAEELAGVALPGSGTYFLAIDGAHDRSQMYRLELAVEPGSAVLSLAQSDSEDPAWEGASLWYSVEVANQGGAAAGVVATLALPPDVSFVETVGCAEDPAGVPTCSLGTIGQGAAAAYTARVLVAPGAGTLESQATAVWSGGGPASDVEITQTVAVACTPEDLVLDGGDSGTESSYLAEGSIDAGSGFAVDPGESVRFVAGERVVLTPGFSVRTGASFRARTDVVVSCD